MGGTTAVAFLLTAMAVENSDVGCGMIFSGRKVLLGRC